jgi:hypothetical protein
MPIEASANGNVRRRKADTHAAIPRGADSDVGVEERSVVKTAVSQQVNNLSLVDIGEKLRTHRLHTRGIKLHYFTVRVDEVFAKIPARLAASGFL